MKRTLSIETAKYVGKQVRLAGWVNNHRDHGKIVFIDLRDSSGLAQIVFSSQQNLEMYKLAQSLRPEWVVEIIGKVAERPRGMENPNAETGKIEILAGNLKILAKAKTLPFAIDTSGYEINEEIRLKYRYLDLRRERLQKNLKIRHRVIKFIRDELSKKGFIEIETPLLTKSTPEGARDFVVPSRLQPGKFYALPQSPQQYKQLLMIAGIERYFQIAKAIRDEDTRGDRQSEHTQLDLEMSFIEQEDILSLIEDLFTNLVKELFPEKKISQIPWPRITYQEAIKKYGTDKPDLRENYGNKKNPNELAFGWLVDFPLFEYDEKEKKIAPMHHMFTAPCEENLELLNTDPLKVTGRLYDIFCNGAELASGSIRINNSNIQTKVFEIIGMKRDEYLEKFGHLLEAYEFGGPPHGGIAFGLDRFLALLQNEPNIREVIAFPKTGDNRDLMMQAPAEVSEQQLKELYLKVIKKDI